MDIHDDGQIDEIAFQADVGDVCHPHLIRTADFQPANPVGIAMY